MAQRIHALLYDHLPVKRRQTPKGWWTFDAPCCQHRGHNPDTRSRGNILLATDGSIVINCYNCGFKARYTGGDISKTFEQYLGYLGIPRQKIQELKLSILSEKINGDVNHTLHTAPILTLDFPKQALPEGSQSFEHLLSSQEFLPDNAQECLTYLASRGRAVAVGHTYYWCNTRDNDLNRRILIPFYFRGQVVGWTGRYAGRPPHKGIPRYFNSDLPSGYLFNCDIINERHRKFMFITEGPFDAISIKRNVIPLLGKNIQSSLMKKIIMSSVSKIYIALDKDAQKQALTFCQQLMSEGKEVYLVDLKEKDPSDMGFVNFTNLIQNTLPLTFSDLLEKKLQTL